MHKLKTLVPPLNGVVQIPLIYRPLMEKIFTSANTNLYFVTKATLKRVEDITIRSSWSHQTRMNQSKVIQDNFRYLTIHKKINPQITLHVGQTLSASCANDFSSDDQVFWKHCHCVQRHK